MLIRNAVRASLFFILMSCASYNGWAVVEFKNMPASETRLITDNEFMYNAFVYAECIPDAISIGEKQPKLKFKNDAALTMESGALFSRLMQDAMTFETPVLDNMFDLLPTVNAEMDSQEQKMLNSISQGNSQTPTEYRTLIRCYDLMNSSVVQDKIHELLEKSQSQSANGN